MKKRNPVSALQLSLKNAKDFYKKLFEINLKVNVAQKVNISDEEWKNLLVYQRALWIALIIEIGRIFDVYNKKPTISFKNIFLKTKFKQKINLIYGEIIIGKILETRNTFTAHISEETKKIVSVDEICNSNLEKLLDELEDPLTVFTIWFTDNHMWEKL